MVVKASELTSKYLINHQSLITFKTTCNRLVALNLALYMLSDPVHTCLRTHQLFTELKLQLHDAIYRLRFYSNLLTHILSLSNLHNDLASIQKNWDDKSHHVIVALAGASPKSHQISPKAVYDFVCHVAKVVCNFVPVRSDAICQSFVKSRPKPILYTFFESHCPDLPKFA